MSTSNTVVDEKYNEAIQSLKKINNLLFYDELKNLLKEREQTLAELNEEVYESVEKMQKSLKQVPIHISEQLKEEIITPQSELFDSEMNHFNENIIVLEKKISQWYLQYQEYIAKTEKLLVDLKELQRNDYKFMDMQTGKVLDALRSSQEEIHGLLSKELSEQASIMNVKYESIGGAAGKTIIHYNLFDTKHIFINTTIIFDDPELHKSELYQLVYAVSDEIVNRLVGYADTLLSVHSGKNSCNAEYKQ